MMSLLRYPWMISHRPTLVYSDLCLLIGYRDPGLLQFSYRGQRYVPIFHWANTFGARGPFLAPRSTHRHKQTSTLEPNSEVYPWQTSYYILIHGTLEE